MDTIKKYIIDNVNYLNEKQMEELIKLIKDNDIEFMENANGIFIFLKNMDHDIITKIYEHVKYCSMNKQVKTSVIDIKPPEIINNLIGHERTKITKNNDYIYKTIIDYPFTDAQKIIIEHSKLI
jgi:succinate dehydrogenase flavin-adding protein (antitoxin of CptAB toxin-antitoxin module)